MKKTIKRILAVVMAVCVIFAYSGVAMATGGVKVGIKVGKSFKGVKQLTLSIPEVEGTVTAEVKGAYIHFELPENNGLNTGIVIGFVSDKGDEGTITVAAHEGNDSGTEHEDGYDQGRNNYEGTVTFSKRSVISIDVSKVWDDGNNQDGIRPESVTVKLYANGKPTKKSLTLDATNEWKGTFEDLPHHGKKLETITYTVQEDHVEGYIASYSNDGENEVVITNTHEPTTRNISVNKVWDDDSNRDGIRPGFVEVQLLADGNPCGEKVKLSAENNWRHTYEKLEKNSYSGDAINYTVEEITVDGYDSEVTGNMTDGYIITNSHTPETITISGTKTWVHNGNAATARPGSIVVNLIKKVGENDPVKVTSKTVNGGEDATWQYEFTNLYKYENGELITYSISEEKVDEYQTTINGFDITNTYTPGKTSVSVEKVWNDAGNQDGIRPGSVKVQLYADGVPYGEPVELKDGAWSHTFNNLPKYRADNTTTVIYTVKEIAVVGYDSEVTGNMTDGYTITNTHTPERITISGTKTWDDNNNAAEQRPEKITVKLFKNNAEINSVEVSANSADDEGKWHYQFADLPKYEDGTEIDYSVEEVAVKYYTSDRDGYDLINTFTPGKISISVTKNWDFGTYENILPPETVTIKLLADGKATDKELILGNGVWTGSFTDLDEFVGPKKINYTIEEVAVPGYNSAISGDAENGFVVKNTYAPSITPPETDTPDPLPEPPGPMGPTGPIVDPEGPEDIPSDEPGAGEGDGEIDVDPAGDTEVIDDADKTDAETESKGVQTGDVTDMYLWLTIFGAALVSVAAVAGTARRREEN